MEAPPASQAVADTVSKQMRRRHATERLRAAMPPEARSWIACDFEHCDGCEFLACARCVERVELCPVCLGSTISFHFDYVTLGQCELCPRYPEGTFPRIDDFQ